MKLRSTRDEAAIAVWGVDHGCFLRKQGRAAVWDEELGRGLGFSRGRQGSFAWELVAPPVGGLEAEVLKVVGDIEMGGGVGEDLRVGGDGRGAAAGTTLAVAGRGAVIV